MPGLFKHADGSYSRVAVAYDGTQTGATVNTQAGTAGSTPNFLGGPLSSPSGWVTIFPFPLAQLVSFEPHLGPTAVTNGDTMCATLFGPFSEGTNYYAWSVLDYYNKVVQFQLRTYQGQTQINCLDARYTALPPVQPTDSNFSSWNHGFYQLLSLKNVQVYTAPADTVPVIDFHTRAGEFGNTQLALNPAISILALDVSARGLWSYNGNSGVVNGKRNYVPPGGPITNPVAGWLGDSANGGAAAVVSNNGAFIQVANAAANLGVATKTFSVSKGKKYVFSVTLQSGSTPGTSFFLRLGSSKYAFDYADLSQTTGITTPTPISLTFTATSSSLYVAMGNQNDSAANVSLWSVPTLVKG
jgi:hypothetical protein